MKQSPTSSPSGMQPTGCGELSPAERREFEEHLASCRTCQSAVSKLAAHLGSRQRNAAMQSARAS